MNYDNLTVESIAQSCAEKSGFKINKADLESQIQHLINIEQAKQLTLTNVVSSFICVKDQKPPKNTELIAQDPKGIKHLTSWRESYRIFMCQSKQEDSSNWRWKQI